MGLLVVGGQQGVHLVAGTLSGRVPVRPGRSEVSLSQPSNLPPTVLLVRQRGEVGSTGVWDAAPVAGPGVDYLEDGVALAVGGGGQVLMANSPVFDPTLANISKYFQVSPLGPSYYLGNITVTEALSPALGLEKSLPSPLTGLSVDLLVALPGVQEALTAGAGGGQASQGQQQQ